MRSNEDSKILIQNYCNAITKMFSILGRNIEKEIVTEWSVYLIEKNIDPKLLESAINKTISDPRVNPYRFTIANFLNYILPPELDVEDEAIEEWENVVTFVSAGNSNKPIPKHWDQRTASAVRSMGGFRVIGDCDESKLSYLEHNFIKAYKSFAKIHDRDEKQYLLENSSDDVRGALDVAMQSTDINKKRLLDA